MTLRPMVLPLGGDTSAYLDLYARYRRDRSSVPLDWIIAFEDPERSQAGGGPRAEPAALVRWMFDFYRTWGHALADLDPLGLTPPAKVDDATLQAAIASHRDDLASVRLAGRDQVLTLGALDRELRRIYAGHAALEAQHVPDPAERAWLQEGFERAIAQGPDAALLARSLEAVVRADEFETFIRTKYPSKKRFGVEGAESSIVFLKELLRAAAHAGCREAVIGGMHRGRLGTLATVLGKSLPTLIAEIKGRDLTGAAASFTGDVPYHLGLSATLDLEGRALQVSLLPHPSHLTVVAPVALGAARARQRRLRSRDAVLPLLLHTDAAFAGQGLVSELLQIGGLAGYSAGGAVHLVVNNQIGFTTLPAEGRSSRHPSDIGKAYGIPVLHVNGDDPAAVARMAALAMEWRTRSARDIIVDLVCYRRNGHNELDEPRFTTPLPYTSIDARPSLRVQFSSAVQQAFPAAHRAADDAGARFRDDLQAAYLAAADFRPNRSDQRTEIWATPDEDQVQAGLERIETGCAPETLARAAAAICGLPDDLAVHPKVRQFYEARTQAFARREGITFATAEALAFASLLDEGISVRLSGQDSVRGTFTQRHLAVHDTATGRSVVPLARAASGAAVFEAINSPLSEYGVLSFEYGHSLADQEGLVVWEAQFGDFLNGAQVVVDQFIVSAEAKWKITSGLVVALPHGLEGQGPDHSSARIERLLLLCAGRNMVIANPSTSANLFHLLRRQVKARWRKPLFLIAPKSLLRQRDCASPLAAFETGTAFRPLVVDRATDSPAGRVVLCSGKVAYDLLRARAAGGPSTTAVVRIEQLYPFPGQELAVLLAELGGEDLVWCQEEPENQGAWAFVRAAVANSLPGAVLRYAGRPAMAAAAGGSVERHDQEQSALVADALGSPARGA